MNDKSPTDQLRQAYQQAKKQSKPSALEQRHLKHICRAANSAPKQISWWQRSQWTLACGALIVLATVMITQEQTQHAALPVYALSFDDYEQVETHSVEQGHYVTHIREQKQALDKHFDQQHQKLNEQRFYGRLVHSDNDTWFVADCRSKTLLEIKQSVLNALQDVTEFSELSQGQMLALDKNTEGHLTTIIPAPGNVYACP
ncbi:hypothetical protein CWB99_21520 [Pseudoalteromonas rubra]|uniref:Uncharacterized protein n=1 Tax=Pseudoalteromonas rubra TaxID=43658 RepID=A0A5S3WFR3_9GAMM|nr:hypothetical protein [Pseudoalteromonas rubra]TMP25107.1 hypothetical protein CWB99_21520 [Pseudoalteromonas rubra]TMP28363.1 hypothetical protein CWC00_21560 [Pseudoalteromonas rubra]